MPCCLGQFAIGHAQGFCDQRQRQDREVIRQDDCDIWHGSPPLFAEMCQAIADLCQVVWASTLYVEERRIAR